MKNPITRRVVALLAILAVGLVFVIPSFTNWQELPEAQRPWYAKLLPGKKLKLGLDLQGGIHLVLGVDVQKAIDNELDRYAVDLPEFLQREKLSVTKVTHLTEAKQIQIDLQQSADKGRLLTVMNRKFDVLAFARDNGDKSMLFNLTDLRQDDIESETMRQALETIRNRVDQFGVSEPEISTQGKNRILIQLPGLDDPERARQLIGKTAQLEFKLVSNAIQPAELFRLVEAAKQEIKKERGNDYEPTGREISQALQGKIPADTQVLFGDDKDATNKQVVTTPYLIERKVLLTGETLDDAHVSQGGQFNEPVVAMRFNLRGADIFERITRENVRRQLAIILDDKVNSAPSIQGAIAGGRAQITLGSLRDHQSIMQEARDLVIVLRAGALPAPVEILENRSVGPSLGSDSIRMGAKSMIIGSLAVFFFMMLWYRLPGFFANLGLLYNLLFMLAILAGFEGTLTLPGIAGLVLTLGMAIDANIIIFERIREELGTGKSMAAAVREGYSRANLTIMDANLTTLIAGLVLLQYGSGPTKGFSVTLIIGLFTSYFSSIWISKWCLEILVQSNFMLKNLFTAKRS